MIIFIYFQNIFSSIIYNSNAIITEYSSKLLTKLFGQSSSYEHVIIMIISVLLFLIYFFVTIIGIRTLKISCFLLLTLFIIYLPFEIMTKLENYSNNVQTSSCKTTCADSYHEYDSSYESAPIHKPTFNFDLNNKLSNIIHESTNFIKQHKPTFYFVFIGIAILVNCLLIIFIKSKILIGLLTSTIFIYNEIITKHYISIFKKEHHDKLFNILCFFITPEIVLFFFKKLSKICIAIIFCGVGVVGCMFYAEMVLKMKYSDFYGFSDFLSKENEEVELNKGGISSSSMRGFGGGSSGLGEYGGGMGRSGGYGDYSFGNCSNFDSNLTTSYQRSDTRTENNLYNNDYCENVPTRSSKLSNLDNSNIYSNTYSDDNSTNNRYNSQNLRPSYFCSESIYYNSSSSSSNDIKTTHYNQSHIYSPSRILSNQQETDSFDSPSIYSSFNNYNTAPLCSVPAYQTTCFPSSNSYNDKSYIINTKCIVIASISFCIAVIFQCISLIKRKKRNENEDIIDESNE